MPFFTAINWNLMINSIISLIILETWFVILSKNIISSLLLLINIYLLIAILFLFIGAEFLAITLIIVYIGAISILFLFVIMMLNLRSMDIHNHLVSYLPIGCFITLFLILEIIYLIDTDYNLFTHYMLEFHRYEPALIHKISHKSNINFIAEVLYNYFFIFVIYAAFILLVAMIGSISLTIDPHRSYQKRSYDVIRESASHITFWNTSQFKLPEHNEKITLFFVWKSKQLIIYSRHII